MKDSRCVIFKNSIQCFTECGRMIEVFENIVSQKHFIERPDAIQSAIRVGRLLFNKTHPDYFKFQVLNTILGGYFGDNSIMFTVGEVTDHAKKLIEVTKECLRLGIEQCKPGKRIGDIGYVINNYAVKHGYSTVYEFCGHGVGLKFHEEPEVSHIADANTGPIMQPGMIFTIEPMINAGKARAKVDKNDGWTARTIDGKLSAQFEHTILVTPTHAEVLTDVENEFKIPASWY
jgi:methionine aminopeptidase